MYKKLLYFVFVFLISLFISGCNNSNDEIINNTSNNEKTVVEDNKEVIEDNKEVVDVTPDEEEKEENNEEKKVTITPAPKKETKKTIANKTTPKPAVKEEKPVKVTYYCSEGFELEGTNCVQTINVSAIEFKSPVCGNARYEKKLYYRNYKNKDYMKNLCYCYDPDDTAKSTPTCYDNMSIYYTASGEARCKGKYNHYDAGREEDCLSGNGETYVYEDGKCYLTDGLPSGKECPSGYVFGKDLSIGICYKKKPIYFYKCPDDTYTLNNSAGTCSKKIIIEAYKK